MDFQIGQRVRLVRDVELYPLGTFPAGLEGTISEIHPHAEPWEVLVEVKLDTYFDALDEWENNLHFFAVSMDNEEYGPSIASIAAA